MEMTANPFDALNTCSLTFWKLQQQCEYTFLSSTPPITLIGLLYLQVPRLRPLVLMSNITVKRSKVNGGKLLGGDNRSARRKKCPSATLYTKTLISTSGLPERQATTRPIYGTELKTTLLRNTRFTALKVPRHGPLVLLVKVGRKRR